MVACVDVNVALSLPVPKNDGACAHLTGLEIPCVPLSATSGGRPDDWNSIPGARGCTPQACSFRNEMAELRRLGVKNVFGVSTQDASYQAEAKERLHLPYQLLSDGRLEFAKALKLPTLEWKNKTLIKRLALATQNGTIVKVWYPVFPPDTNARDVVDWLAMKN
ncbi:uncharacterized protein K460DRAFT_382771 [Cucurbitaria berberidis CBS 394.84]|uniref:Redoxin domain-containing protein n=1 Tax=Cucurbitaria berberidis CBS 394.84 TaxID=1168544 RepID=A0A9P4GU44_9PLEO|nr:uncharacterized protein K460DRAFT_382771 [Cucurbitaria berberidis CBS 394.84]KAF1851319.1 hypothetical protein K460DRAFT_382771 [Cucurbitaria berberidis CBS 394.84]